MTLRDRLNYLWIERGAYIMAIVYIAVMFVLMVAKHDAFNTRVYDFARFSQAIWNTLDGEFLFSSIKYRSILGDHFSPIMALAAPFLLIWPDERVLFLIQAVNVAVAGLLLYKIIHDKRPELAPWFLLVFLLNPALHEVTLFEVRRIVFALPFLALALYALSKHNRWLMLLGLVLALLAKENIAFIIFMIGLYLLIFERDWKWGAGLIILAVAWLAVISLWVIPYLNTSPEEGDVYSQLYYFSYLGDSYNEIITNVLADPLAIIRPLYQATQLNAILRILLPLGLILPFIEPRWVLFTVPYVIILLLSSDEDMYQLGKWYPATILVVMFAAIAVGWDRIPKKWERWVMSGLLLSAIIGFILYSPAPLGGRYEPGLYKSSQHDQLADQILDAIPPEASVAAQGAYVPHLVDRFDLYQYPWIKIGKENTDYIMVDRQVEPYPYDREGLDADITNMVADPHYIVAEEADGIYLIRQSGEGQPAFDMGQVAEGTILLDRLEVAVRDRESLFSPAIDTPVLARPGDEMRISLYWEALADSDAERTVSVRLTGEDGWLHAQHDSMPVGGTRPTSWWERGDTIRDVYYLSIPPEIPPGEYSLDLVLYDTFTQETVPFDGSGGVLKLQPVQIDGR
jgi:uncharacterized membrane protein